MEAKFTFDRVVRMILSTVVIVAVLMLLRYLADVLIPFAAAVVLAYLINPLVTAFESKVHRRGIAVGLTLSLLGVVGLTLMAVLLPMMVTQAKKFARDLDILQRDLTVFVNQQPQGDEAATEEEPKSVVGWNELRNAVAALGQDDELTRRQQFEQVRNELRGTYIGDVVEYAIEYTQSEEFRTRLIAASESFIVGASSMFNSLLNIVLGLAGLIIVLLYLVFLLLDFPVYARSWKSFLPPGHRDKIVGFLHEFDVALRRYFRGQALIAAAMAVLFSVGFMLIELPMAIPLGLLIGALNMVPYLQAIGLIPAIMMAFLQALDTDATFASCILWTLGIFAFAQVLQDALITPKFMGQATGLRPLAIMLGVFIWGKLLGFLGVLLAIPLTCLGIAYYRRFVLSHSYEETKIEDP